MIVDYCATGMSVKFLDDTKNRLLEFAILSKY